ncbi:ead/Ea22-like family protein [Pseudomonas aeruginosa]|uniref:hypothetical protein n=1 Tax=Pseudomonas aeruginosa TaxID=287 RepID=UPI00244A7E18|nr:hypothetical protein [Pseudomonas aeruginosa]MDH0906467.1 ead/Ea22-like family protein [Pseudomonas aeruginosa]MDH1219606.1 ead/Ea22-like family protein [Pseudomonas aeruginosa]MDH1224834.1 ead/Ea22-like family protein [Pseudomonas aeruginosa]
MTNHAELRRLAKAATPGARYQGTDERVIVAGNGTIICTVSGAISGPSVMADAEFLCATDPNTILALLDEIDRLKAENEAVLAANRDCIDWFNQIKTEYDECASTIPGVYYMDPPDGGDVSVPEQLRRMARDAARYRWLRDSCTRQWDVMYRDIEVVIKGDGADDCEDLDGIIDAALEGATQ